MKLFNVDEKHDRVNAHIDLGQLSTKEFDLVKKVLTFLDNQKLTSRYNRLVLATNIEQVYDEENIPTLEYKNVVEHAVS